MAHAHTDSDVRHGSHARSVRSAGERRAGRRGERTGPAQRSTRHHASQPPRASFGNRFAFLCLASGGLGFVFMLLTTMLSRSGAAPDHSGLTVFSAACALVSIIAGVRAQVSQLRHWSRRVKRKLLIGFPLAFCTALAVAVEMHARLGSHPGSGQPTAAQPSASTGQAVPEDDSLIKPGWYGEILSGGILLVITSYAEESSESRRFNKGLFKPVAYATLSVINTGSAGPATLASPRVTLILESGEREPALDLHDVLTHGGAQAEAAAARLSSNKELPLGGMIADIPICMDAPYDWSRVVGVEVQLGAGAVTVPGKMMTAAEKQTFLFRGEARPSASATNVSAEEWFKNL